MPELVQFKFETIQKYVLNILYETVFRLSNYFHQTCLVSKFYLL